METQNNNDSLSSLIWTFAPKHLHSGAKTVKTATFLAVAYYIGLIPKRSSISVTILASNAQRDA